MASYASNLPALRKLAVPAVCVLIAFLAYSSQLLFHHLEPGPLTRKETIWFNSLVACIWWSYERACRVDPGRLPRRLAEGDAQGAGGESAGQTAGNWCRKCKAVKPPRAHHCRQCNRCIPKMDHHCPWTANCVSHTTFPHFLRFVLYAVASMGLLAYHLSTRISLIYAQRNLPAYLGPSMPALAHLLTLLALTTLLLFVLTVLLVSAANSLATNTTMIETWEIERHAALAAKARRNGGVLHAPGGRRVRVRKQEFPYDIGVWPNIVQGMGTANLLVWPLPCAGGPANDGGWAFEVNGFEDADVQWPPPDPDRMGESWRPRGGAARGEGFALGDGGVEAFRARQQEDYLRRGVEGGGRRQLSGAPGSYDWLEMDGSQGSGEEGEGGSGEEGWADSQGGRLRDFGVDEDAEVVGGPPKEEEAEEDEDDIPLGELLRRRRRRAREA